MTPGLVSVLILNWNGAQFLSRCLASVRAQTYRLLEIVVIDNGSIDGSADQMAGQADVRLIRNGRNLGFAMAYDQAIPSAAGEFILLLNMDALLAPDYVRILVEDMLPDTRLGLASGKLLRPAPDGAENSPDGPDTEPDPPRAWILPAQPEPGSPGEPGAHG